MTYGTPDPSALSVDLIDYRDDQLVAAVVGEIDHNSAGAFYDLVLGIPVNDARQVILDFSGVGFCDSSAISALINAARDLQGRHVGLSVATPPRSLTRALEMAGLTNYIPTHATVENALAASPPRPD